MHGIVAVDDVQRGDIRGADAESADLDSAPIIKRLQRRTGPASLPIREEIGDISVSAARAEERFGLRQGWAEGCTAPCI